jgi:hypothetical protein
MTILQTSLGLALTLLFMFGNAQEEPRRFAADRIRYSNEVSFDNDFIFSIGVNSDMAIGDWKKFSGFSIGPELGLWYHFNDNWCLTGRLGFNRWFGKQYVQPGRPGAKYEGQSQFYGYAGVRYNFTPVWWINPELGYGHVTFEQKKEGNISWGLNAGADIFGPSSIIGVGLGYQRMDFDNASRNHIGLRLRIYIGVDREKYDESDN